MFSTILGMLKSPWWLSSSGTQKGELPEKDSTPSASWGTRAPAKGLVLGKFTKSASDYKDSSLRRKEKKAKEKNTFTSKNSFWLSAEKVASLLWSFHERNNMKRKEKTRLQIWALVESILRSVYWLRQTHIAALEHPVRSRWGLASLASFRLEGQAVDSGPHSFFKWGSRGHKSQTSLTSGEFSL